MSGMVKIHNKHLMLIALSTLALAIGSLLLAWCPLHNVASGPRLFLWAWQRSEDFSFIDPDQVGVAVLVASVQLKDGKIEITPRLNPVVYPQGTQLLAVIRLDLAGILAAVDIDSLAQQIAGLVLPQETHELQIDFDARVSQRMFYKSLLTALHKELPEHRLSITALASWCLGDQWITGLPAASAVPMLYRMGRESPVIRQHLSEKRHFPARICQDNIGYSSDEPIVPVDGIHRIFLYHTSAWDEETFNKQYQQLARMLER